eukprot:525517_1
MESRLLESTQNGTKQQTYQTNEEIIPVVCETSKTASSCLHSLEMREMQQIELSSTTSSTTQIWTKIDEIDQHYSSLISEADCGCCMEILFLIPTILYSFIGLLLLNIFYFLFFRSFLYLVNTIICLIFNRVLKRIVSRKEPSPAGRMLHLSGITTQATVFAVTMIYTIDYEYSLDDEINYLWWLLLIIIPITGFGRIYFGQHYIASIICGVIEATIIALSVCLSIGSLLFLPHDLLYYIDLIT